MISITAGGTIEAMTNAMMTLTQIIERSMVFTKYFVKAFTKRTKGVWIQLQMNNY